MSSLTPNDLNTMFFNGLEQLARGEEELSLPSDSTPVEVLNMLAALRIANEARMVFVGGYITQREINSTTPQDFTPIGEVTNLNRDDGPDN